jgi:hypothetical protein
MVIFGWNQSSKVAGGEDGAEAGGTASGEGWTTSVEHILIERGI